MGSARAMVGIADAPLMTIDGLALAFATPMTVAFSFIAMPAANKKLLSMRYGARDSGAVAIDIGTTVEAVRNADLLIGAESSRPTNSDA